MRGVHASFDHSIDSNAGRFLAASAIIGIRGLRSYALTTHPKGGWSRQSYAGHGYLEVPGDHFNILR